MSVNEALQTLRRLLKNQLPGEKIKSIWLKKIYLITRKKALKASTGAST